MAGVLFFTTSTCPNCKPIKPIIEHLKEELEDSEFGVSTIVVDQSADNLDLARNWQVRAVPTLLFYRGIAEVSRIVGQTTAKEIEDHVEACLQKDVFKSSDEKENTCGI